VYRLAAAGRMKELLQLCRCMFATTAQIFYTQNSDMIVWCSLLVTSSVCWFPAWHKQVPIVLYQSELGSQNHINITY